MQNIDLHKFENKRILIVGDIILDEFVYSTSTKKSPEYKDVPILNITEKKQYLGGAANVALNIKKLKAIPYLVGSVGNDKSSEKIYELLHQHDITNEYVFTNHQQKTTTKSRVFQNENPIYRIDEDAVKESMTDVVYQFLLKNICAAITNHKPHAIILQDYNKGVLNNFLINEILKLAQEHKLLICVDPKFENWNLYQKVDLFKPNKKEFFFICEGESCQHDSKSSDHSLLEMNGKSLQQIIKFKNLLVTLGADGNYIYDGNKSQILNLKSKIQNPDVCGAGDTVIAVATLGLLCGFSLEQVAELSNKAGAIVCRKENVQPILFEDLK
ncbi:MAG TPA: PfkB family carbohydrate kinase [Chitinophagales bacterium]|nr:PfkB family carbohydrate kinase [Chitinophagales bacterium]